MMIICRSMNLSRKIWRNSFRSRTRQDSQVHAILGLNLRTAIAIKTSVITASTEVSRQRYWRPTPLSMIPRAMTMNHRAGTMLLTD